MKVFILSCGPGLQDVVSLYGHSSEWIPDLINQSDIDYTVVKVYDNIDFDYHDADALIITGSKYSVYDKVPWIDFLKKIIIDVIQSNIPILGICFGHQLLACCVGGKVEKNIRGWELGSYKITLTDKGILNPIFKNFKNNDIVYESHQDVVSLLPPNCTVLAYNSKGIQSFCFGDFVCGVQFHPEFSYEITRKLMDLRLENGVEIDDNNLVKSLNGKNILTNFIDISRRRKQ